MNGPGKVKGWRWRSRGGNQALPNGGEVKGRKGKHQISREQSELECGNGPTENDGTCEEGTRGDVEGAGRRFGVNDFQAYLGPCGGARSTRTITGTLVYVCFLVFI